ncbi:MAG: S8 family serine peptidase [Euryarchaeota archaeon]|nr:S8 family serine peptidase [Euryarchaeota archaeon]
MPVQVLNETGSGYWDDMENGIKYAADNDADVISMSFGGYSVPNILLDAVNYAYGKGVFLCAAAGNKNKVTELYPAAYENVTAVAMTDLNDKRYHFLTFGATMASGWISLHPVFQYIARVPPTIFHLFYDQTMIFGLVLPLLPPWLLVSLHCCY